MTCFLSRGCGRGEGGLLCRKLRREEQALADRRAHGILAERLGDQETSRALYRELGLLLKRHPTWKMGVITSDPAFERNFGRRADHKRRLYNGRLECEFCVFE